MIFFSFKCLLITEQPDCEPATTEFWIHVSCLLELPAAEEFVSVNLKDIVNASMYSLPIIAG